LHEAFPASAIAAVLAESGKASMQGNRMSVFADLYPASCYPELISPFPIHRTAARHFGQRLPHAPQKRHFYPGFCLNPSCFLAIFNHFLRLFMTHSKVNVIQNKWVSSVCLPEKGTPHPPLSTVELWNSDGIASFMRLPRASMGSTACRRRGAQK
jgi:hypothetical protein